MVAREVLAEGGREDLADVLLRLAARREALQAFVPDLRKGCEGLLARNPAVLD